RIKGVTDLLAKLHRFADDERSKLQLKAIGHFMNGRQAEVDNCLLRLVKDPQTTPGDLKLYRSLTTSEATLQSIAEVSEAQVGISIPTLAAKAAEISKDKGESAGIQFIMDYQIQNQPLPDLSARLAVAGMYAINGNPNADDYWEKFANDYKGNAKIVQLVLDQPTLRENFKLREQLIEMLKTATGESAIPWQIADIRLQLDKDDSQRIAAKSVLRLTSLLQECPNAIDLYLLMDESYTRLEQPAQAMATMAEAMERNLQYAIVPLRAAECAWKLGDKQQAIRFAEKAAKFKDLTPTQRQRIADVFIKTECFENASDVIATMLPSTLTDNDDLFLTFASYATAAVQAGKVADVQSRLAPHIDLGDRWFELWLNLPRLKEFPIGMADSWMTTAETYLTTKTDSTAFRRKITGTWVALADNHNSDVAMQAAARTLEPLISDNAKTSDAMMMARIYYRIGKHREASSMYAKVIRTADDSRTKVAALNNLANLMLGHAPAKAESKGSLSMSLRIEEARSISPIILSRTVAP
ncbi:MAG: hypothetical protein AAF497_28175, partial [Planctomycetota bacterium]